MYAIRSYYDPDNMGKIIRMAHNVGAERVLFIQGNEQQRESKIRRTAGFSYDQMPWQIISEEEFSAYLQNYSLTVLETCDGAENIFKQKIPDKTILLAGSESHGLPEHVIDKSNCKVFIPMHGGCRITSYNVCYTKLLRPAANSISCLNQTCCPRLSSSPKVYGDVL